MQTIGLLYFLPIPTTPTNPWAEVCLTDLAWDYPGV